MNEDEYKQVFNIQSDDDDLGYHLRNIVTDVIDGVHEYIARCLAYIQHSELKMYSDYIEERLHELGFHPGDTIVECTYIQHIGMKQIAVSVRCYVDGWAKPEYVSIGVMLDKEKVFEPVFSNVNNSWFENGAK